MKQIYVQILLLLCLSSLSINAQVGINTTSPNGALDIDSTTDGILVPRVALSATNVATVLTPTVSELVYNTFTSAAGPNEVTPGFYYWNGSLWVRLATANTGPDNWELTGNTGTNPATDYVGTTDATDLVLRTNDTDRIHVSAIGNVGVSEPTPSSKLDIIQTETTGNSIEINHNNVTNASSAAWIRNIGANRALNVQNLSATSNAEIANFYQGGNGAFADGLLVTMDVNTPASTSGIFVNQLGLGFGEYILMPGTNNNPAMVADHAGAGDGLDIFQTGTGDGIYNDVNAGAGQINFIGSNNIGVLNNLQTAGGTGGYTYLAAQDGNGYYVLATDNPGTPSAGTGGDVYSFFSDVRTATPTTAGTVFGSVFAGNQYGNGHGIILTHSGAQGRNAEFNITNPNNPDAAIFTINEGQGSAIVAQNQNNAITGTIAVGDFAYTGTDVDDHIGVEGASTPVVGWGIGVLGTGNWYSVFSNGDFTATGVKAFTIDHPKDPSNKMLKHFAIESNEVLNMYRGVVQLDANGEATVQLPDYFSLINKDFSYQLTAIGTSQNPYVKKEITENLFVVGGAPNTKVSWTVYADRNDAYMQTYPEKGLDVVEKEGERRGKYFSPELYNQPESKGMFYHEKSNTTPTTTMQLPKGTSEHIEKLKKKEKKKPTRPKNNSEDSQN